MIVDLLSCPQVSTSSCFVFYCIRTFMSRKLISDLYRLLRAMFVTSVIFAISTRNVEETFASFFVFFQFLSGTPKKHLPASFFVFLSLPLLFSHCSDKKFLCFFQIFSIQYFFLDPKSLRFPCCRSFFGQKNWLKKSQAKSGRFISSAKSNQQLLAKRKHDF